jgi:acetyl-CoA/propionyl-CoA carboxylase biotin carboxyl carrier protein
MKVVLGPDEAAEALESAQREAQSYFGRPSATSSATSRGRVTSRCRSSPTATAHPVARRTRLLGQRRHQKLIEESPAPNFPDDVRRAMGEAAVKVSKACGYVNAGTVEFLYQDGEFFFLEMNTRLQVEHPVTELVTGLDLVEWQLRIASGEPLDFTQDEVRARGPRDRSAHQRRGPGRRQVHPHPGHDHAIRPAVRTRRAPRRRLRAGDTISQYYDNLIGKLIVWAPDREKRPPRMLRAIEETRIEGVRHHVARRRRHPLDEQFVNGTHSTNWVESESRLLDRCLPRRHRGRLGRRRTGSQGRHRRGQRSARHRRALGARSSTTGSRDPPAPPPSRVASTTPAFWAADRPA